MSFCCVQGQVSVFSARALLWDMVEILCVVCRLYLDAGHSLMGVIC